MRIRKATAADIDAVEAIYNKILDEEEAGRACVGWQRGVYPTRRTAEESLALGELYVLDDHGVKAAARINSRQVAEYALAAWEQDAPEDKVLVLHTLVVDPAAKGRGCGTEFVDFYEEMGKATGRPFLRMDTNEKNRAARALYHKLGYREAGSVPCEFNGICGVGLVCLEKTLD